MNRWYLWLTGLFAIKAATRSHAYCMARGGNAECGQNPPAPSGRVAKGPTAALRHLRMATAIPCVPRLAFAPLAIPQRCHRFVQRLLKAPLHEDKPS